MTPRCLTAPSDPSLRYRLNKQEYKGLKIMLNVEENNFKPNAIGNADSVTLNAYASNNSNAFKLRCVCCDSVLLRTRRFVNASTHRENAWFVAKYIAFPKMMVVGMRGIVKILLHQVRSFYAVATMLKLAHHFLPTLKNVDSVAFSGTEFGTFNPFVVGSTPARPTKFLNEIKALTAMLVLFLCLKV